MSELDPAGLIRARKVAQWELGSPGWADEILAAYFDRIETCEAYDELTDADIADG